MLLNKKELYECMLNYFIDKEEYENCIPIKNLLDHLNPEEYYVLDEIDFNIEEFDQDEDYPFSIDDDFDEKDII